MIHMSQVPLSRSSTMAAGLEAGVVSTEDRFFCPGYKVVEDRRIHCAKRTGHGAQNFVEGAQNSCNPVFIEVGLRLGVDRYYKYFKTVWSSEKKQESIFLVRQEPLCTIRKNMGEVELATVSFGQSFQITPVQLATTVSSVINGGKQDHAPLRDQRGKRRRNADKYDWNIRWKQEILLRRKHYRKQ